MVEPQLQGSAAAEQCWVETEQNSDMPNNLRAIDSSLIYNFPRSGHTCSFLQRAFRASGLDHAAPKTS